MTTTNFLDSTPTGRLSPITQPRETGRAFWERMGKPKWVLAPMVDQSEFVCFSFISQGRGPG